MEVQMPLQNINEQFVRLTYALVSLGQLKAEIDRDEVLIANGQSLGAAAFPFEFTNGMVVGKSTSGTWRSIIE